MQDGRLAQDFWVMGEASLHEAATAASESIKDKALWFGLWQELYISSMHHAPLSEHVNVPAMHRLTHGSDDRTWTNRMLLHLAEIVTYCYSEERNTTTYNRLVSYSATWMESKPPTFDPVYVRDAQGAMFPEIWLLNDVVAAGLQYYHLVKILLLAYNPRVPLLGAAQRAAKERGDALIREDVRTICGIAESMDGVHPAHL
ncbi:hypothetical protein O9K51_04780 [Purpureocillium lavendulum]|uniref:Uncharacterized protein n=1 Tax=Purpureocillium lavendulum TaxID=1247861 RepID=A0AB34FY78_9HYPO|nr:hypothetical protein O9K51_04780 [Purpureocillium lavendulum]